MTGQLVVVATPIGNLGDLSPRAVETLAGAALIVCEDTRRTGRLLEAAGVSPRPSLLAVHQHNEARQVGVVVDRLVAGDVVAVVTDAGLPGVSDPGERLVRAAIDAGIPVSVVPGPSAGVAALVASGLGTERFSFEGFLPRQGAERADRLAEVVAERRTVVLYEAPHRLARTLGDLAEGAGPERRVVLARELTKLHEEIWRGALGDAVAHVANVEPRGEYVVVLEGASTPPDATDEELSSALGEAKAAGSSTRDAVTEVAATFGVARRRVYGLAHPG